MANYKRKRPRTKSAHNARGHTRTCWLNTWPRWHDIEFHTRPRRREEARLLSALRRGADAETLVWPARGNRPHVYYW